MDEPDAAVHPGWTEQELLMNHALVIAAGLCCLAGLAGCDTSYTPGAHHQDAASTGSMLSGTDTGVNADGNTNNPSITSNLGNGAAGHGH
jgi:hypothetical protein